jgi:hypothetical protein
MVQRGQTVRLTQPVKGHSVGTSGVVFWAGHKFGEDRCGFNAPSGVAIWAPVTAIMIVDAAIQAVKSKTKSGPRVFCKGTLAAKTYKALNVNGTWWPRSQASYSDGWICATEWIVKQKYDGVIPQCWKTKAGMEAWIAKEGSVVDLPAPVVAPEPAPEPPAGSWASTARAMARDDDSGTDWDAWKDEMKMAEPLQVADADITDVLCDLFGD